MNRVHLVVPGNLQTLTGGYEYDRRIAAGLRDLGWDVHVRELDDSFPFPTAAALAGAGRTLAQIPDGERVLVDGLAFGAMPLQAEHEANRLRLIAIVHHPLAEETGLENAIAARLRVSERRALATVRLVIVTSERTATLLPGYGVERDRIAVVRPGTDEAPLARGSSSGPVQLLCVATIVPRKGHEALMNALERVADLGWLLTCVGSVTRDPATADRVRQLLRTKALEDRVRFVGEVEGAPLAAYYDAADLFVLPTFYEGYGMAIANALARGTPVISTATGAIPELIGADTPSPAGVLVPPGDATALGDVLRRVIADPEARRALAAGARLVRNSLPSWAAQSARIARALDEHVLG